MRVTSSFNGPSFLIERLEPCRGVEPSGPQESSFDGYRIVDPVELEIEHEYVIEISEEKRRRGATR